MKLIKTIVMLLVVLSLGGIKDVSATSLTDYELNKFLHETSKEGNNDKYYEFEFDNSEMKMSKDESKSYLLNNFRYYPYAVVMGVDEISYYNYCGESETQCKYKFKFTHFYDNLKNAEYHLKMKEFANTIKNEEFNTKIRKISDYVQSTGRYGDNTKGSPHSPITFLEEGYGVCQAYATMTQDLLTYAGVDNYLLRGTVNNGQGHVWNIIIDAQGAVYHLDNTWDDGNNLNKYHMIDTQQLDNLNTHTYEKEHLARIMDAHGYYKNNSGTDNPDEGDTGNPDGGDGDNGGDGDTGNGGDGNTDGGGDGDTSNENPPSDFQEFLDNIDKAEKVTDLGIQPNDKAYLINFTKKIGNNYEEKIKMYNAETHEQVELASHRDKKEVTVMPKTGTLEAGKYYLIILAGVESDDTPPIMSKIDFYVTFEVQ